MVTRGREIKGFTLQIVIFPIHVFANPCPGAETPCERRRRRKSRPTEVSLAVWVGNGHLRCGEAKRAEGREVRAPGFEGKGRSSLVVRVRVLP